MSNLKDIRKNHYIQKTISSNKHILRENILKLP